MSPLPNIPANLRSTVPNEPAFNSQLEVNESTLSSGEIIKRNILETTFPTESFGLSKSESSFEELDLRVNKIVDRLVASVNISSIPTTQGLGNLPKISVPNPAEIRQFVNQRIEQIKRKRQEALISTQLVSAQQEETPFTARQVAENSISPAQKVCVATESGVTLEVAQKKAEFKLLRVLKCSGEQRVVDVRQENGVFIVTVKTD